MDEEINKLTLTLTIILALFLLHTIICSRLGLKPYIPKHPAKDKNIARTKGIEAWAESNGFAFIGFYTVLLGTHRVFMAAWQSKERAMYLFQNIVRVSHDTVVTTDFTTIFEGEIDLTTDASKSTNLFPKPPWCYCQTFPKASLDGRYTRHLEAEEYLKKEGWLRFKKLPLDFEEEFASLVKKQNRWELKHFYWMFGLLYFYVIRRWKWHNKSIQQQHELGMIRLSNEIHPEQFCK